MLKNLHRLHSHSNSACLVTHCSKENVSLRLPRSECVCVDCDDCAAFTEDDRKPDYIGIVEPQSADTEAYWFVLEMKSRVSNPKDPVDQIQTGINKIQNSPYFALERTPSEVVPIIVHGRKGPRVTDLAKYPVRFRGRKFRVFTRRSGDNL